MEPPEVGKLLDALIEVMKQNGSLHSPQVEAAFRRVPRHYFLPEVALENVYADAAIMVKRDDEGRWTSSSSQPSMMAIMLEQLDLRPGLRVLEIGAGSGYNAALMAELVGPGGSVVSVDIQPDLIEAARKALARAGYPEVQALTADGGEGYPPGAPYDRIILTVGSHIIAPAWREQLVEGGRLVLPLIITNTQKSIAFERRGDELVSLSLSDCGFMPLQGAFAVPADVNTPLENHPGVFLQDDHLRGEDAARLSAWLDEPWKWLASGVTGTLGGFLGALMTWLSLRSPRPENWAMLTARDEAADQGKIPHVIATGGGWHSISAYTYLLEDGAAALSRPPGEAVVFFHPGEPPPPGPSLWEQRFELHIAQLGPSDAAARYISGEVQAWERAGRPASANLRVRAIPAGREYQPLPGEYLLEKPYTRLILSYIFDD